MQSNKRKTESKTANITLAFSFTRQKPIFSDFGYPKNNNLSFFGSLKTKAFTDFTYLKKKQCEICNALKSIPTFSTPLNNVTNVTPKKEHQDIQDTLKGVQWCVTVCNATLF